MSVRSDFWSRRKAQVEAEAEADRAALVAEAEAAEMAEREEMPDAELLAELDLPDPDTLGPGDDFSAFMAKAVPDRLRLRALRKLWLTNPVLANVDGLVDYGEDFTDAACVIENLQCTYQVGKGMTKHVEEMARQAEQAEQAAREDEPVAEAETRPEEATGVEDVAVAEEAPAETAEAPAPEFAPQAGDDAQPAPRRRMHFSFENQPGEVA